MKRLFLIIVCSLALFILTCNKSHSQNYSIKGDVLGAATTTFSFEGSMALNQHWTLHLPLMYNPWTFSDNKKFKHLSALPGARYWMIESYGRGWFVGANAIISTFNVGGFFGKNTRKQGDAIGLGVSAGYSIPLAKRWNIELEGGIGVAWTQFDKYKCATCGDLIEKNKDEFTILPNKVSVGIVFLF